MKNKNTKLTKLEGGTLVHCIKAMEAKVLDDHVEGYFKHGISAKEGDVIFDVGANIGVFGIRVSQKIKDIELHCFEPIPTIYEVLTQNAKASKNEKFHTYQKGVGADKGELKFTYFPNSPALSTSDPDMWNVDPDAFKKAVKGSLKNAPKAMWYAKYVPDFFVPIIAKSLMKNRIEVECPICTISEIIIERGIEKIDLLKIDCEGQEWDVLMGIEEQHWPLIKSLVIEIHDVDDRLPNTKSLLRSHGFGQLKVEKEKALSETNLVNLYAVR